MHVSGILYILTILIGNILNNSCGDEFFHFSFYYTVLIVETIVQNL